MINIIKSLGLGKGEITKREAPTPISFLNKYIILLIWKRKT